MQGFIIAFTSEFIPKMVYRIGYSADGSLHGYTNFTLSTFDPRDFEYPEGVKAAEMANLTGITPEAEDHCRYHDFRYPPGHPKEYRITEVYWHILAARLAFVVVFQNFVALSLMAIKWIVPNMSTDLKERIRREAYLTNEIIIRTELLKAKGKLDLNGDVINAEHEDVAEEDGEEEEDNVHKRVSREFSGPESEPLRRRFKRTQTGDITDGHIVV